jgi:glycosyltransferase involved in cell wall biosynthesis
MSAFQVLNLVTNDEARFYRQQVDVLERQGVETTTLAVPTGSLPWRSGDDTRSLVDYLRLYPRALRHSFGRYDLVHANYGLTAPAALAQPNHPVVVSLWGSDLFGTFGRLSRFCAHHADAVIVMSDEMAAALDDDCEVIPHGVDLSLFHPIPTAEARETLGWRPDARHVLFPYPPDADVKDYPRAERVVAAARERLDSDVELQTVSGVPHDRMPLYMNAADALLLTSRHEGSPNVVKEALGCNLPIVATDVGDVSLRLDGVDPSAVGETDEELVDGLVDVLGNPRRSEGRASVQSLSLERMGEQIRGVYGRVVDR